MSPIVLFLVALSLVSCEPITLPSPHQQIIIEQPSGHVTTIPIDIPTEELSRGERMTMETPGFRIGDSNEPIEIIPPPIGNWVEPALDIGEQTIQSTNITITTNHTTINTTNTEETIEANNPWSAMTGINITIAYNQTESETTPSPTWIDIQNEREHSHQARRPAGFPIPNMRNMTTSETSFNMTIHGNLTSFNLTTHNMTSNHTRQDGSEGWSFFPGGGETIVIGNITGSPINMSITAPNTSVIISTKPNGTVTIHTNITTPTTTPTTQPTHPGDTNTTFPSIAILDRSLSFSIIFPILFSCVVVY